MNIVDKALVLNNLYMVVSISMPPACNVPASEVLANTTVEYPANPTFLILQLVCDARVEKLTPNPTPVFVGGSPEVSRGHC